MLEKLKILQRKSFATQMFIVQSEISGVSGEINEDFHRPYTNK